MAWCLSDHGFNRFATGCWSHPLSVGSCFLLSHETQPVFLTQRMLAPWLFSSWGEPSIDQRVLSSEALCCPCSPTLVGMTASLRQSFVQRGNRGITYTLHSQNVAPLRKSPCRDQMAHGTPAHAQLVSETEEAHSWCVPRDDLFRAGLPSPSSHFCCCDFGLAPPTLGRSRQGNSQRFVSLKQFCVHALERSFRCFTYLLQHRKAISHVLCLRSAIAGSTSLFGRTIPAHDQDPAMGSEPLGKRISSSLREQINRAMGLQIFLRVVVKREYLTTTHKSRAGVRIKRETG